MTLEMLKKDTYDSGFTAGEEYGRKEGISIGLSQGITQGEHKKAVETAKSMMQRNISIDIVAECTGLSPEEIEKL